MLREDGRRGEAGLLPWASKTVRAGRLSSRGRLERGVMEMGARGTPPSLQLLSGGGGCSLPLSAPPPWLLVVGHLLSSVPRGCPLQCVFPGKLEPPAGQEQASLTLYGGVRYRAGPRLGKRASKAREASGLEDLTPCCVEQGPESDGY